MCNWLSGCKPRGYRPYVPHASFSTFEPFVGPISFERGRDLIAGGLVLIAGVLVLCAIGAALFG